MGSRRVGDHAYLEIVEATDRYGIPIGRSRLVVEVWDRDAAYGNPTPQLPTWDPPRARVTRSRRLTAATELAQLCFAGP